MKKILMATTIVAGSIASISAANAVEITSGSANNFTGAVTIVQPLDLTENQSMQFGNVQKPATDGTVVLGSTDNVSATGGVTLLGGNPKTGNYTISGDTSNQISISIAAGTQPAGLALSDFTGTYGVTTFTDSATNLAAPAAGTTLKIGATLAVTAASVTVGAKTLPYNITVTYQ